MSLNYYYDRNSITSSIIFGRNTLVATILDVSIDNRFDTPPK
jgi:hypothetical protein